MTVWEGPAALAPCRCRRCPDSSVADGGSMQEELWLYSVVCLFVTVPVPVLDLFLDFVDGILPGTERIVHDRIVTKLFGSARSTIN